MSSTVKSHPFQEASDSLESQLPRLIADGKLEEAARDPLVRQKAKGLAVTFLRGNKIIKEHPDGREEVIATLVCQERWTPSNATASGPT